MVMVMKTQTTTIALIAAILTLNGCFSESTAPVTNLVADEHVSANSLDWHGRYVGVVPCADCPGIETVITLNQDYTYQLRTRYLDRDDRIFERRGNFVWEENGNVIVIQDFPEGSDRYHVGENVLFQLDKQGKRITGELAENYILHKAMDNHVGDP
jgi:copper homeostasis protein (lipoprotein)